MNILCQQDIRWRDIKLGNSPYSLGQSGCFVVVIAEILGLTPDVVNRMLLQNGGFARDTDGFNDLIDWTQFSRIFSGVTITYKSPYNNNDVLQNIANGNSVLVEVNASPIGGTGLHAVRFVGNKILHDPWLGIERPTGDFPMPYSYVIFSGSLQKPDVSAPSQEMQTYKMPESVFLHMVEEGTNYKELLKALDLKDAISYEHDGYKKVLAYIQRFVIEEVNRRTVISQKETVPTTPSVQQAPTIQAKSFWKKDVSDMLNNIWGAVRGRNT